MHNDLEELKRNPRILSCYKDRLKLKRESGELVDRCPFHKDDTPSFHVYEHEGTYLYKCFGCQRTGREFLWNEDAPRREPAMLSATPFCRMRVTVGRVSRGRRRCRS